MDSVNGYQRILVAADMQPGSDVLFAHGVKLALRSRGQLFLVHAHPADETPQWHALPTTRDLLCRWGVLRRGSHTEALNRLGIEVHARSIAGDQPVPALLNAVNDVQPNLIVVGTEGRSGLHRLLQPSVGEDVARGASRPTLFIGRGVRGIVDPVTGQVRLSRVLVPIGPDRRLQEAVNALTRLLDVLHVGVVELVLLNLGPQHELPVLTLPARPEWSWRAELRDGPVVHGIIDAARDLSPDLVVMATRGHDDPMDAVLGSMTERVLRKVRCPFLAVPL